MKFVSAEELKPGMRLAKPIYNRSGVLLYERDTSITQSAIKNVKNFGLIGLYILEDAEPLPPMSAEDLEFEQSQTVYLFRLRDCFNQLLKQEEMDRFPDFVNDVINRFGMLDHRVNFNQNLRSSTDFLYKHAISIAILSAMISHALHLSIDDQRALVTAGLLFDIGYSFVPKAILDKGSYIDSNDEKIIQQGLEKGLIYLEPLKNDYPFMPKALFLMQYYIHKDSTDKMIHTTDSKLLLLTDIIKVADNFDRMTGMTLGREPESEISAMKKLSDAPYEFNPTVVDALAQCIHIVPAGASVDLSTNDKAIVLVENQGDFMHPLILRLSNNKIYDLSDPDSDPRVRIIDLMKTMDNRVEIDEHTLKQFVADERIKETAKKFRMVLYGHP